MGSFGIFAIVVTFIFVIYYVVMICLDLFGTKGEKKDSVEVIHAGTPVENTSGSSATTPINVNEEADGKFSIDNPDSQQEETKKSKIPLLLLKRKIRLFHQCRNLFLQQILLEQTLTRLQLNPRQRLMVSMKNLTLFLLLFKVLYM